MPKPLFTNLEPVDGLGFDAVETGQVVDVTGYDVPIGVVVGGTFVATIKVEVSMDNSTWAQFGSDFTAAGTLKIDIPVKYVRARCSAYTSGAGRVLLGATNLSAADQV